MKVSQRITLIVFGAIGLVGALLCTLAYYLWQQNHELKTKGIATTGVVVGYHTQESYSTSRKRRQYRQTVAPVVQFIDVNSQTRTATSDVYTSPPRFSVGEKVKLWYDPQDPERMLIAGAEEWLFTTILASIGLLLSLAGIPNFFKTILAMLRPKPAIS